MPNLIAIPLAAAALAAGATWRADDVAMFERRQINQDLSVVAFGIMEDTRCRADVLCLDPGRLVVDVVVSWRGRDRELPMRLGASYPLGDGTLTLVSSDTPPTGQGAIPLKYYRLNFVYSEG